MLGINRLLRNSKYFMRNLIGTLFISYPLFSLSTTFKDRMVTPRTAICIDGFPRSANSFAYNTFSTWNPHLKIAHHLHVPMQIIQAIKLGIPCIVLIRTPIDALSSLLIIDDDLSIKIAIWSYINFYEKIFPFIESLIIADFHQVINEFHYVTEKTNVKFGTNFHYEILSPEIESQIFSDLRNHHKNMKLPENLLPVPDNKREKLKLEIQEKISQYPSLKKAHKLYWKITQTNNIAA